MKMTIQSIKQTIMPILKKHDVIRASLFGSIVRKEIKKSSDIDILVEVAKDKSLFEFMDIQFDLEDVLKKKVDLVEYHMIKRRLKPYILKGQVRIL